MAEINRSELRHRMLREVSNGSLMRVWTDMAMTRTEWRRIKTRAALSSAEARAVGTLDRAGLLWTHKRLGPGVSAPVEVQLSPTGKRVLSEWNQRSESL